MLNQKEQDQVLDLVKKTKELIFRELEAAKVTVKGAADIDTGYHAGTAETFGVRIGEGV